MPARHPLRGRRRFDLHPRRRRVAARGARLQQRLCQHDVHLGGVCRRECRPRSPLRVAPVGDR
eukprot:2038213-Pleurochrysis_carterae.AAC.1